MRAPDWSGRLEATIEAARLAGWGWDGRTCLDLLVEAAEAVAPTCGARACAEALGGRRAGPRSSLRALRRLGGLEAAVEACADACGFPEIPPGDAASGDWGVAFLMGDASKAMHAEGVLRMSDMWVYRIPEHGVVLVPAVEISVHRAWAVG